jgi:hypothetical protein
MHEGRSDPKTRLFTGLRYIYETERGSKFKSLFISSSGRIGRRQMIAYAALSLSRLISFLFALRWLFSQSACQEPLETMGLVDPPAPPGTLIWLSCSTSTL